jgi:uncharacterized cupin superfamily protein
MHIAATTIHTTPTLVGAWSYSSPARIIQNTGDVTVFLGDESVSASGAPALSLAPGQTLAFPGGGAALHGVVAAGTGAITVLEVGG